MHDNTSSVRSRAETISRLISYLIDRKLIGNYFNNLLIVLVIFKAKIVISASQMRGLFFVICDGELNIFGFLTVCQINKEFKDITLKLEIILGIS